VAHPERGILTIDEVSFVDEIYAKVEKFIPSGGGAL